MTVLLTGFIHTVNNANTTSNFATYGGTKGPAKNVLVLTKTAKQTHTHTHTIDFGAVVLHVTPL